MTINNQSPVDLRAQVADALAAEAGGVRVLLLDEGDLCEFWTDDGRRVYPLEVTHSFYDSPGLVRAIVSQVQAMISVGESSLGHIAERIVVSMREFRTVVLTTDEGSKTSYSTSLSVTVL